MSLKGKCEHRLSIYPSHTSQQFPSSPAMMIRGPQISSSKQPNPVIPDCIVSQLPPKKWLGQDAGGAVGLGIVVALHKSSIVKSQVKPIVSTAPVDITSLRSAACRAESCQHGHQKERCRKKSLLCRSTRSSNSEIMLPAADFLSHCSLCRKQLRGKDIYMYLQKAFCSIDCRYQQIVSDELQAKSRRSKMARNSCSPGSGHGRLFFTGVVAT